MIRFDDSVVMAIESLDRFAESGDAAAGDALTFDTVGPTAFAECVGNARGSSARERAAHADRLEHASVAHHAIVVRDARGAVVAGGQVAVEGTLAGLYDVFTLAEARGHGHGERVCRRLLAHGRRLGASAGYLQVDSANDAARRLYRRLGFADAYPYHYRAPAIA
jgi:ribosomal protein S18 acetylase RimI-like enzyme